ncbi:hypothetical protein CXB51_031795 [Gossypium anomalum]|uniref:Uncharacterized protein n=1 Tax=Gossypium anomalum TaxID=47600 RepID=A0A8J6CLV2_9ROSI|nr:hypothetical protein CXB51_031795 [Gossypium anomalum]
MPYYGLIPLRVYSMKLSYFYSVSSAPISDSVFRETLPTKTLPTLPSPPLPLSHLKKADGQSFIAGSTCKQGKNGERTSKTGSADELNIGYFDDMSELKQHGGKGSADELNRGYFDDMSELNNTVILIPDIAARKFHAMDVIYSDGRKSKLPIVFDASKLAVPQASLVCLSFRANSQAMVDYWSKPFMTPLVIPRACSYMRFYIFAI